VTSKLQERPDGQYANDGAHQITPTDLLHTKKLRENLKPFGAALVISFPLQVPCSRGIVSHGLNREAGKDTLRGMPPAAIGLRLDYAGLHEV
jgi:hypothetical protein